MNRREIKIAAGAFAGASLIREGVLWWARRARRTDHYESALALSRALGRPLVVVGDPSGGMTSGYGCGDLAVDLSGCGGCPVGVAADVCKGGAIPLADNSAIVFVSCVLEYVDDPHAAYREILRVAGDPSRVFVVAVDGWTLTSAFYPGAKWVIEEAPPTSRRLVVRSRSADVALLLATGAAGGFATAYGLGEL